MHLAHLPKVSAKQIDAELEVEFKQAMRVIELGLAERDKAKINLRWPLSSLVVHAKSANGLKTFKNVILSQLNIKDFVVKSIKDGEMAIELNTTMTPELEAEGFAREIARKVQGERKNAGLQKSDSIELLLACDALLQKNLIVHLNFLKERTNARKIEFAVGEIPSNAIVFTVKERKIEFIFRNLTRVSK